LSGELKSGEDTKNTKNDNKKIGCRIMFAVRNYDKYPNNDKKCIFVFRINY